jgi:hypothetical protein
LLVQHRWSSNWFAITLASCVVLAAGCDPRAEKVAESDTERALPALAKPMEQRAAAKEGKPGVDSGSLLEGDALEAGHGAEPDGVPESPRSTRAELGQRRAEPAGRRRASSNAKQSVNAASASKSGELAVKRLQFSQAIAGREPVDPEQTFAAAQLKDVYAFVELVNPSSKAGEVVVTFVPPAGKATRVTLEVGSKSRWRTWAKKRAPRTQGTWTVIVSTPGGEELSRGSFEVIE